MEVGDKWGYIDKAGKFLINPQFDKAYSFSPEGLARVEIGDKWGYIDKTGKHVWNPIVPSNAHKFIPDLVREDAVEILKAEGYDAVVVGAVIHGTLMGDIGGFGGENIAMVLAVGSRHGESSKIDQPLFYDRELGWFYYEWDTKGNERILKLWTTTGFKLVSLESRGSKTTPKRQ